MGSLEWQLIPFATFIFCFAATRSRFKALQLLSATNWSFIAAMTSFVPLQETIN